MWLRVLSALALLLAVIVSSCSSSGDHELPAAARDAASTLELSVLADSFIGDSSAAEFELATRQDGNELFVAIQAVEARGLRALYYELEYDATQLTVLTAQPAEEFGNSSETLSMLQPLADGRLSAGQVLIHPGRRAGFSGDGTLATLRFRLAAQPQLRSALQVNDKQAAIPLQLKWNNGDQTVSWLYNNPADYDQNGEVNVADLTPLAQNFLSEQPGGFDVESAQSVVDGDGNGLINLADITPIGVNFGNAGSGGYRVFEKIGGSTAEIGTAALAEAAGDRSSDRLSFSYSPAGPLPGNGYFVRLDDGLGNLGFEPGPVFVPENNPPFIVLSFVDRPSQGSGTDIDPYILTDAIIGNSFTFQITDEGLDVTGEDGVEIRASDQAATLSIDQDTGAVQFDPVFANTAFSMDGMAAGDDTQNSIHFIYEPTLVEMLYIMPDPADTDWGDVEGDGLSQATAFVIVNPGFNLDGSVEFSFIANTKPDGSGESVDVGSLTWDASVSVSITNDWMPPGSAKFRPNLTDCYLFATDGEGVESNHVYVIAKPLG